METKMALGFKTVAALGLAGTFGVFSEIGYLHHDTDQTNQRLSELQQASIEAGYVNPDSRADIVQLNSMISTLAAHDGQVYHGRGIMDLNPNREFIDDSAWGRPISFHPVDEFKGADGQDIVAELHINEDEVALYYSRMEDQPDTFWDDSIDPHGHQEWNIRLGAALQLAHTGMSIVKGESDISNPDSTHLAYSKSRGMIQLDPVEHYKHISEGPAVAPRI